MTVASRIQLKRPIWQNFVMLTLGFWLGGSLILDWVIMPSLYFSGMMTQTGFTTAGYTIFWNFNRVELLSAAVVLTGILALSKTQTVAPKWRLSAIFLSLFLFAIALTNTYFLTPQMSATGIHLNLFDTATEIPTTMNQLHAVYWGLEALKLAICGTMLGWLWFQQAEA